MAATPAKRAAESSKPPQSRPKKRFKKQAHYSSESDSEAADTARDAPATKPAQRPSKPTKNPKIAPKAQATSDAPRDGVSSPSDASDSSATGSESDSAASDASGARPARAKPKRHDPAAFAASLTAILGSKLSSGKRADPVLARSRDAHAAAHAVADEKLERRARRTLRDERRADLERGRVRDVLLGDRPRAGADAGGSAPGGAVVSVEPAGADADAEGLSAADVALRERRLRKTAQRGVVRLFNAVRAAQVRGEEEVRKAREQGLVGMGRREAKVGSMERQAFLDMVGKGGGEVR